MSKLIGGSHNEKTSAIVRGREKGEEPAVYMAKNEIYFMGNKLI